MHFSLSSSIRLRAPVLRTLPHNLHTKTYSPLRVSRNVRTRFRTEDYEDAPDIALDAASVDEEADNVLEW